MSFAKPIFTTRGKQIELQGIEGQQIIFTKIKIGDGRITTQSPSQLTDLINVIAEAPITSLKRYDAYAAIRSIFQNIDVPEAFWWREVGLFAIDPATQEEVLYAYQNAYDTAEYITPSSLVTKKINWTIYIDDGENLGADIHKKMVFCSVEDLDEHNDLEGAHEVAFTAHNADTGSHTDIRNKIGTDISSHNTSTSAHENRFNEFVKGVTGSNATLTITKGNGMTSTVTVNNVANATNATNATKATQDSAGQQINTTYIKDLSVSGKTITYTKGDGATGTITTQDTVYTHPIGTVQMFAGKTIPAGWLLCNGADISRTTYSALYNVIGTTYGAGDGSTTFNLPNLIDMVVQGAATAGTYKKAGLPNITGKSPTTGETPKKTDGTGAFRKYIVVSNAQYTGGSISTIDRTVASFDASLSNPIYGNSTTVQPPALTMLPIIKY